MVNIKILITGLITKTNYRTNGRSWVATSIKKAGKITGSHLKKGGKTYRNYPGTTLPRERHHGVLVPRRFTDLKHHLISLQLAGEAGSHGLPVDISRVAGT